MTLLIAMVAAITTTLVWYNNESARKHYIGTLTLAYWGASLMWLVDAIVEYIELREAYFTSLVVNMLSDTFLGLSAVTLGAAVWVVAILFKDPDGVCGLQ